MPQIFIGFSHEFINIKDKIVDSTDTFAYHTF